MSRVVLAAVAGTVLLFTAHASEARPRHHHAYQRFGAEQRHHHRYASQTQLHGRRSALWRGRRYAGSGGRPGAWCGWYMRHVVGSDPGAEYNLARNWAHYGGPAHGPAVGAIVVWSHHVGKIVGREPNGEWVVQSGNDGHGVRTRPRSVARAIAFRWPA